MRSTFGGVISLDPCTSPSNHLRATHAYSISLGQDGLVLPWRDGTYCNPPFGDDAWLQKVAFEAAAGYRIGLLLSVCRTEVAAMQTFILPAYDAVVYFRGKLKFNDGASTGMQASWMFWFNVPREVVAHHMGHLGAVR